MKKILLIFTLISVLLVLSCVSAAAEAEHPLRLTDDANVLTTAEEKALLARLDELSEEWEYDIVIHTMTDENDEYNDSELGGYAKNYFLNNGYGMGDDKTGTILVLSIVEGGRYVDYYIDYFGDEKLPYAEDMKEYFYDDLVDREYYNALSGFVEGVDEELQFPLLESLVGSLVAALIIAFIAVSSMKSKLKSVRSADYAREYVRPDSFRLDVSRDLYLYSTVTRIPKPKNNPSRGGFGGNSSRGGGGRA